MQYAAVNLITHSNDVKVTKFGINHGVGKRREEWWDEGPTAAFTQPIPIAVYTESILLMMSSKPARKT